MKHEIDVIAILFTTITFIAVVVVTEQIDISLLFTALYYTILKLIEAIRLYEFLECECAINREILDAIETTTDVKEN